MLTPETEQTVRAFLMVAGGLLIPLAVILVVVLFQTAFLLKSLSECLSLARYEILPMIKELRLTADHVEEISYRASTGLRQVSDGLTQVRPMVEQSLIKAKHGARALVSGIARSFNATGGG